MKVLLLNPPFTDYGGLEGHGGKSLPLNLAYLAAYLREKKPKTEIRVLDCEGLRLTYDRIEEEIRAIKPDLVGITCPTPAFVQVLEICRIIKSISPNIITVVGGPHPTAMPKETVSEKNIDVAVLYEGEYTFTDLVETIEKNESLERVKGIFFKDSKGGIYKNPPREIIKDLDSLPFPARDLFPLDIYFPPPTKRISNKK